tara:strand:+ start:1583 stop:2461 length:879 start_codon:yes stop_codon:yes gene_type:complete
MQKNNHQSVKRATQCLIFLSTALFIVAFDLAWLKYINWVTMIFVALVLFLVINIIFLNHRTHFDHGADASEEFFNFPLNIITAFATLLFVYQVADQINGSSQQTQEDLFVNLAQYSSKVVVGTWETLPMDHPDINPLYQSIFGNITGNNGFFMTEAQWTKRYPTIPYVPFEGNELEWHYAAKYCQQMIDVIRMFQLDSQFPINDKSSRSKSSDSVYAGWFTTFKMFLNNPTVRNVWEQYKYRHANPELSAWVQYYVLDIIDSDQGSITLHDENWNHQTETILEQAKTNGNYS